MDWNDHDGSFHIAQLILLRSLPLTSHPLLYDEWSIKKYVLLLLPAAAGHGSMAPVTDQIHSPVLPSPAALPITGHLSYAGPADLNKTQILPSLLSSAPGLHPLL